MSQKLEQTLKEAAAKIVSDPLGLEKFEREESLQADVLGFVDDAHSTRAKFGDDVIIPYTAPNHLRSCY